MNFLGQQRYPHIVTSIGNEVCFSHGKCWWYAVGQAEQEFRAARPRIREQLDAAFRGKYISLIHFEVYMIGRCESEAHPTIMFFCEEKEPRKSAKKILRHILKDELPGFRVGDQSRQPVAGQLILAAAPSSRSDHPSPLQTPLEVLFDPQQHIRAYGMAIYVRNEAGSIRQATANLVFQDDQYMFLSVSHAFKEMASAEREPYTDDSNCDLGSGTESEDDSENDTEYDSENVMGPASDTSVDSLDDRSSVNHGPSAWSTQRTNVSAKTEVMAYDIPDSPLFGEEASGDESIETITPAIENLKCLGHLLHSSTDQDWALISITDDGVLSDLTQSAPTVTVPPVDLMDRLMDRNQVGAPKIEARTSRGILKGIPRPETAYLRLPGSSTFQEVYQVVLHEPLVRGDCGAGMFDASTGDVFGHVVATSQNMFTAYIMPASTVSELARIHWALSLSRDKLNEDEKGSTAQSTFGHDMSQISSLKETSLQNHVDSLEIMTGFQDTDEVFFYMQANLIETIFRGEPQKFLRKSAFDDITTKHVIRLVIQDDDSLCINEEELDKLVDQVAREGKKLFATCVQGSIPLICLKLLLDSQLTDADMPLTKDHCPGVSLRRKFVSSFVPNQALFNTAYFQLDGFQDLKGLTKPIDYDENQLIGKGAFGSVYSITIHPAYASFMHETHRQEFAMKVTQQQGTQELPFHRAMAGLSHPHLMKCLTSFTFASQYHMIYEMASCDLEKFMCTHKEPSFLDFITPQDLAQQLLGTIGAVSLIHSQPSLKHDSGLVEAPRPKVNKSGYHHDIKPDNILVFQYDHKPWLKLSDFSCARVNNFVSSDSSLHRQSWHTSSKSGTPVYRAPEFTTEGKTSRPYDIWSLGCVFLEFITWYLEGYEALTSFRTSRRCFVKVDDFEDEGFYYIDGRGPNATAHLRTQVVERLEAVTLLCKGPLRTVANAIPEMLEIDPRKRPTAEQLIDRFKAVGQASLPPSQPMTSNPSDAPQGTKSTTIDLEGDIESGPDFGPMIQVEHPIND